MTGEILHQRFAVLERTGPDRYLVFDLQALEQVHLQLLLGGAEYLVIDNAPPAERPAAAPSASPERSAAVPPPLPVEALPAPPLPLPEAPVSRATALEAAWFVHGERMEEADEQGALLVEDEPDYPRYQQVLEQLAEELSAALFAKYALDSGD